MGKKIPMWQTIMVMLVMIGLLVWSIVKDSGGEPHIALILAAAFAGIVACLNGWKWAYLEQGILASINRSMQAILILGDPRRDHRFVDGGRNDSFHDVLWH